MGNADYRVLVVDKHPQTATNISTILEAEGFKTEEASTPGKAIQLCKEDGFSLIVIDISSEIQEICVSKHPKLIVVGFEVPKERIKKFKNVVGIVKKPISSSELIAVIKKVLKVK